MELERLVKGLPEYAEDLRTSFDALVVRGVGAKDGLSDEVKWGAMLAAAYVAGSSPVLSATVLDAAEKMTPQGLESAKSAAAAMSLTNNFYRHRSLTSDPELKDLRSGFRLNGERRGGKAVDYKLWCVAVSVLNGCASCVDANERGARELGATVEQVAGVLRLGALVKAIAVVVEAERTLA